MYIIGKKLLKIKPINISLILAWYLPKETYPVLHDHVDYAWLRFSAKNIYNNYLQIIVFKKEKHQK